MDTALLNKNNSAGRFLRLFNGVIRIPQNTNISEVWRQGFSLPANEQGVDLSHAVAALLTAATEELRAMEAHLLDAGIPHNLVAPYVTKAKHAFSVSILNANWSSGAQYLTPEVILAFQWFSFHLEEESEVVRDEDIEILHGALDELEAILNGDTLPKNITLFIRNHATAIRSALRQAPISGVHPLRKAVRATAMDAQLERDELQAEVEAEGSKGSLAKAAELFQKTWKKGAEICGDAEKYAKGTKLVTDAVDSFTALLSNTS